MRLLHLISRFPYFGNEVIVGGSASSLYNLARQQCGRDHVEIMAQLPGKLELEDIRLIPIDIRAPANSVLFGAEYSLKAGLQSLKRRSSYDLLHGHSGYADYISATAFCASLLHIPSVQTIYCPVSFPNTQTGRLRRKIATSAARRIDKIIAISHNVAHSLQVLEVAQENIQVIPPPVNIHRFDLQVDGSSLRQKLRLVNDLRVILFVGSTKPVKNLETVLDSFEVVLSQIPEARLIITTELRQPGYNERRVMLDQKIRSLGLDGRIVQLDIIDNMPELMAAADVLVAPFLDTDGPSDYFLAALEAMAMGRPVVVSAVGAMPEVITREVGYLVSPKDRGTIASALIELLQDPARRSSMGRAASRLIRERFNPARIDEEIQKIYEDVLK